METTKTLFIFSGLPATGKSTLAQRLAAELGAMYLRIDTVEQGLRDLCGIEVAGEGYRLAYRLAADNLRIGNTVVADCCNPVALTRREWESVAGTNGGSYVNIEVVCSDREEHRQRALHRTSEVPNLELPTWEEIEHREYHPWKEDRIVIDTAHRTEAQSFAALKAAIEKYQIS